MTIAFRHLIFSSLVIAIMLLGCSGAKQRVASDTLQDNTDPLDIEEGDVFPEITSDVITEHETPSDAMEASDPSSVDALDDGDGPCPHGMLYIEEHALCIDKYEASRPDATATSAGTINGPAQSVYGVRPWSRVDWHGAQVACQAAGKELCSASSWHAACSHNGDLVFPYGNIYEPDSCVGVDTGEVTAQLTGYYWPCEGGYRGLFDMSGNEWEWTSECSGDNCSIYGGAYISTEEDLQCSSVEFARNDIGVNTIGFRCCIDLE